MLWVTIFGMIIIPIIGWIFNTLITRKIDDLREENKILRNELDNLKVGMSDKAKEGFQTVFKRLDDVKDVADKTFVRIDNYNLHKEYQEKDMDSKFKSLMATMTSQFQNVEDKIDELKETLKNNKKGE